MGERRSADAHAPEADRRAPGDRGADERPRPPGPEEQRGATATSGGANRDDQRPDMRSMMRLPRFWITLLVLLAINALVVPLLLPEPQDRLTISYTLFKQQVAADNVAEITGRGEDIQGTFKRPVPDPAPPQGQPPQTYTKFATRSPTFTPSFSTRVFGCRIFSRHRSAAAPRASSSSLSLVLIRSSPSAAATLHTSAKTIFTRLGPPRNISSLVSSVAFPSTFRPSIRAKHFASFPMFHPRPISVSFPFSLFHFRSSARRKR